MLRTALGIVVRAAIIVAATAGVAIAANAARSDGIPLIAEVEYDIFSQCEDSDVETQAAAAGDLRAGTGMLYVDARPAGEFAAGHADGALSAPYSVLDGAPPEAIAAIKAAAARGNVTEIVVYGEIADPGTAGATVDLAKPLAEQLVESGLVGVKHLEGGLGALKKSGVAIVTGTGGAR
jgi:rhodanese-related sulfurtransferase